MAGMARRGPPGCKDGRRQALPVLLILADLGAPLISARWAVLCQGAAASWWDVLGRPS